MWHRLKNLWNSIRTYGTLRPDFVARRQVNQNLRDRPLLTATQWLAETSAWGVSDPVALFVYRYLPKYSGVQVGRVWLSDRLEQDLKWSRVCWFDWAEMLCKDFWQCFQIDIRYRFNETDLHTVGDLVKCLEQAFSP